MTSLSPKVSKCSAKATIASVPSATAMPVATPSKVTQPCVISQIHLLVNMLVPPILASLLLKGTAILTTSAVLFQGWSYLSSLASDHLSPIVHTLDGPVQGKLAHSRNGSPYWQYFAIPFAEPPVGALRYQPPEPVKSWNETRLEYYYPPGCAQFEPVALARTWGQEDCLYLNVFVPATQPFSRNGHPKLKPVLVYIHGGAFLQGQTSFYRETYIMDQPVILVTLQYRLGPLGFLNFQEENDTTGRYPRGNMGLKDQLMALQWVKRNIEKFGGDSDRITLMGDSAGAASVNMHMLSPKSRGLFQRAVLISGSGLVPWGYTKYARNISFSYGKRLGCPTEDTEELFQCYLKMDPHKLVKLQYAWADPLHEKDEFAPSLEDSRYPDSFLTDTPLNLFNSSQGLKGVPLLAGVTSGEGGLRSGRFRAMPELIPDLEEDWPQALSKVLFLDDPMLSEPAEQLKRYYFQNRSLGNTDNFFDGMTKLASDALFVGPVTRAVLAHAQRDNPTWLFYYDYRPQAMLASFSAYSQVKLCDKFLWRWTKLAGGIVMDWVAEFLMGGQGAHKWGVGHAENCFQIWDVAGWTKWLTWLDRQFSEELVSVIADFADGRKPLRFRGALWPEINGYSENELPYMWMDSKGMSRIARNPFQERLQFWKELRTKFPNL